MMKDETTHRLYKRLSDFLFLDVTKKGNVTKFFFYLIRLVAHLTREFVHDLCPQRAAALAYTSVLSLVPVSALFVLYFKVAGKLDAFSDQAQGWILQTFVAESAQSVTVYIDQFVKNIHTKTLGTLGAIGLIVSAYMLFRTIERSLNDIWKVRAHRSFIARFQILSSLLIIVPGFMVASLYVSGKFQEIKVFGQVELLTTSLRTMFFMAPFLLTLLPFFVILKFLPNTHVRWKPAFMAAIFSSVLFEFAKAGFNFYVVHVIHINRIYGALGLFPVLLLWIYFSWIIILLAVELSYAIQNYEVLHEEALRKRTIGPLDIPLHEEWGLRIVLALAQRFRHGEGPVTKEEIANDVGLKVPHVEDHLMALVKAKLLVLVEGNYDPGYLFSRPMDALTDRDIMNVFRNELGLPLQKSSAHEKKLTDLF